MLRQSVEQLIEFCSLNMSAFEWKVVIADNASVDSTAAIGKEYGSLSPRVEYYFSPQKGRGQILRKCWLGLEADIYAYMDVDLATELRFLPELITSVGEGADVVIGSRLIPGAKVIDRAFSREISSRGYNICLRLLFGASFHDAQCGFKAISRRVRDKILPLTRDDHWFFDTEVLLFAQKKGLIIKEIPVWWRDNQGGESKVKLFSDILYFIRCIVKMKNRLWFDKKLEALHIDL